ELDDSRVEAHVVLANVERDFDWDWAGAERSHRRALALDPNDSSAPLWFGVHLMLLGRADESIAEIRRARELDPLSILANHYLGDALLFARRVDEASAQYRKVIEMDPAFNVGHLQLGDAYWLQGRMRETVDEYLVGFRLLGMAEEDLAAMRAAFEAGGYPAWAAEAIEQGKRHRWPGDSPVIMAELYGSLGDGEQAIGWLERALEARDSRLTSLKVDYFFDDRIRADPRYRRILERVGLTP